MLQPTKRQQEVLDCIRAHVRNRGFPPSREEIAKALGVRATQSVDVHLNALVRKGWIAISPKVSRGIRLIEADTIPLVDPTRRRSAGEPVPVESEVAEGVPGTLTGRFCPRPDYFVEIGDDTLSNLGIEPGDLVAVRAASTGETGDVVIARVGATLIYRRLERVDERTVELAGMEEGSRLAPNPIVFDRDALRIEGVVIGTLVARPLPT